jgi:hypothetical protein
VLLIQYLIGFRQFSKNIARTSLLIVFFSSFSCMAETSPFSGAEKFNPDGVIQDQGWIQFYDHLTNTNELLGYSVIDGMAIHEGDIILGSVNSLEASFDSTNDFAPNGVAMLNLARRWEDGIVYYDINGHPGETLILETMEYIEQNTSIQFIERTTQQGYVNFVDGTGCSSYVGDLNRSQDISLKAQGCVYRGIITHELFHALGVWHEQSRSDRDSYVTINTDNITSGKEGNFTKKTSNVIDIGSYDYESLMHYGATAFSNNGLDTITTIPAGIPIGQRSGLSDGDIATMQYMYHTDLGLVLNTVSDVDQGSAVQAVIEISNLGDVDIGNVIAKDVKVILPLPSESTYNGFSSSDSWSCQQISQDVECELGILERSSNSTLTLDLTAPTSLNLMPLSPIVSASNRDLVTTNNSETVTINVVSPTDIEVELSVTQSKVDVDDLVTIKLALENISEIEAEQVVLVLNSDSALGYTGFNGVDWSCSNSSNVTTCSLSSLIGAATSALELRFNASTVQETVNVSVDVSTQNTDSDLANNSTNEILEIAGKTNLELAINASNSNLVVDDSVSINITIDNIAQYDAEQLTLTLTSDSALGYTSFTGTNWNCNNSGTTTTCTSASLSSAGTAQLAISFVANSERGVANMSASVTTGNTDLNLANNSASTTLVITAPASSGGGSFGLFLLLLMILPISYRFSSISKMTVN